MGFTFILYLTTFLAYPILALTLSGYIDFSKYKKTLKIISSLFILHNLMFYLGYSLRGDYEDYVVFSLEYLLFCIFLIAYFKSENSLMRVFRLLGIFIVLLGYVQLLFSFFLIPIFSQDFEADRIYNFEQNEKTYQSRRYSFGFATLNDITYTYKTYRIFQYLPFEKHINTSVFSSLEDDLEFKDPDFYIELSSDEKFLEFHSSDGKTLLKKID